MAHNPRDITREVADYLAAKRLQNPTEPGGGAHQAQNRPEANLNVNLISF